MTDNAVHALLDAIGLPWQSPRAELEERFGVTVHPAYQWEVIDVPTARPIVDALLWPLSTQVSPLFSPHLPATEFSGVVWFGDDARENLKRTRAQLTAALGPAEIEQRYNTVRADWRAGAASVSLMVWPPELQSFRGSNPAQDRDPRLSVSCHISVETGWRPALSERERAWLASFVPIADVQAQYNPEPASPVDTAASQSELEFVREPDIDLAPLLGKLGYSADGEALIFCHRQLYVVPMSEVTGFRVERMLPAKGGGGSWLEAACRTDYGDGETKSLTLTAGAAADDLNDLAARVAAAAGKPLKLSNYHYDA